MKKLPLILSVFACWCLSVGTAKAQCDPENFIDKCNAKLAEGYTFLKSYSVEGAKATDSKVEYSYVFSKDTNYLLTLCGNGSDMPANMVVTLYDSNRKKLASSYDKDNKRYLPAIGIRIAATGIYYLTFSF